MKLYVGTNSDGTEIISKQKLKRYIDYETNKKDVLSYNDTQQPPHWILDYEGKEIAKTGDAPINVYLTLPKGSIKKMFGIEMSWEDEVKEIDLGDDEPCIVYVPKKKEVPETGFDKFSHLI